MEEFYFDVDVIGVRKKYSVYIMKKHPNGGVHLFKYRSENRSMSTLFGVFFFLFTAMRKFVLFLLWKRPFEFSLEISLVFRV